MSLTMLLAASCSAEPQHDSSEVAAIRSSRAAETAVTYFLGRRDVRRCRFPLCGGYFVRAANRATLTCGDGSRAAECYVAALDTERLGSHTLDRFGAGEVVVRGGFGVGDAGEFGPYPLLTVSAAWEAVGDAQKSGTFYLVLDSGVRCITTPCPSLQARELNQEHVFALEDLELAGVTDPQRERLTEALFDGGAIAVGEEAAGRTLQVAQLYLPVQAPAPGVCAVDADCTQTFYSAPVDSPDACYCPTCPVPSSLVDAARNERGWQRHCARSHGQDVCFPAPCAPPPQVVCGDGVCAYGGFDER
jgi:hypothetical protein